MTKLSIEMSEGTKGTLRAGGVLAGAGAASTAVLAGHSRLPYHMIDRIPKKGLAGALALAGLGGAYVGRKIGNKLTKYKPDRSTRKKRWIERGKIAAGGLAPVAALWGGGHAAEALFH